ncbi:hypothetical protein [Sessilibacter corallicola]|uniref:hypothetical protein n=1 Tax=Sessilibacter corallicola TaxID=2904075 RepID=UPI001E55CBAF|nr:hypothetical protein [Sessilibacter corallicola]MCE2030461.1 hypothetical protein [Sessilibacter corallicola]
MTYSKLVIIFLIAVLSLSVITAHSTTKITSARGLFLDDFVRQCEPTADEKLCLCLGKEMYAQFSPIMRKIAKETYRTWRANKALKYREAHAIAKDKLLDETQYRAETELLISKMPEIWSKACLPEEFALEKGKP